MATSKQSQITTLDDDAPEAPAQTVKHIEPSAGVTGLSGKRRAVTIHPTPDDNGNDAVFVGVNGTGFQIPRNTPCSVPEEVLEVLQTSMVTLYQPDAAGKEVTARTVQRYPFSVHA